MRTVVVMVIMLLIVAPFAEYVHGWSTPQLMSLSAVVGMFVQIWYGSLTK